MIERNEQAGATPEDLAEAAESVRAETGERLLQSAVTADQTITAAEEQATGLLQRMLGDAPLGVVNQEAIRLAGRRARAMTELPVQLAGCASAHNAWAEQVSFYKTMLDDYHGYSMRVLDLLAEQGRASGRDQGRG